jgi:hypothetical protein
MGNNQSLAVAVAMTGPDRCANPLERVGEGPADRRPDITPATLHSVPPRGVVQP